MVRKGFTLIELLVVIGIIMVLMGMLLSAINIVRKHAVRVKCQTLIAQVVAACDQYRQVNGVYPDSTVPPPPGMSGISGILLDASGKPRKASDVNDGEWDKVSQDLLIMLSTVSRETIKPGPNNDIIDPWGHALRYRPVQYYPYDPAAAKDTVDSDPPVKPDSFQVWSIGPNEKDEQGLGDDLSNWKS